MNTITKYEGELARVVGYIYWLNPKHLSLDNATYFQNVDMVIDLAKEFIKAWPADTDWSLHDIDWDEALEQFIYECYRV